MLRQVSVGSVVGRDLSEVLVGSAEEIIGRAVGKGPSEVSLDSTE